MSLFVGLILAGQAVEPSRLAPIDKWQLHNGDLECTLGRGFGSASKPVNLVVKTWLVKTEGQLALVLRQPLGDKPRAGTGQVRLFPSGTEVQARWTRVPMAEVGTHGVIILVDAAFWSLFHQANGLSVELSESEHWNLNVGPLQNAAAALETCRNGHLRRLGADPAAMVYMPPADQVSLYGPYSYPLAAIKARAHGRVVAVATVSRAGYVLSCRTDGVAPHESLSRVTCDNLTRLGRFPTASQGDPDTRSAVVKVTWTLPP